MKWPEQSKTWGWPVLLASDREPFPLESEFCLYKAYSLAGRAFYVEPGLVFDSLSKLNLGRLGKVSQLQVLTVAEVSDKLRSLSWPHRFQHTRLTHSLRAGALHSLIAGQFGFSEQEIAVGILAECLHDIFTCAGGFLKNINHQKTLFDEDDHLRRKFFGITARVGRRCAKSMV